MDTRAPEAPHGVELLDKVSGLPPACLVVLGPGRGSQEQGCGAAEGGLGGHPVQPLEYAPSLACHLPRPRHSPAPPPTPLYLSA